MAVLTLVAVPALLYAQSGGCPVSGPPKCGEWVQRAVEGTRFGTSSIGARFDTEVISNVTTDATDSTELSFRALRVPPSAIVVGLSAATTRCVDRFHAREQLPQSRAPKPEAAGDGDTHGEGSKALPVVLVRNSKPLDLNQNIYYKNRLEFSLDGGWLPINIPFPFDVFLGDGYTKTPLNYTLMPIIASFRWQMNDVDGPWIFRGNWDLTASAAVTLIPRGPETRYYAWIMGIRRNFVHRRERIAPYFDGRLGLGNIDAKEPLGVIFAQGQDFTFTMNMGSGVRFNFSPRYSISAGLNWMHISNLYLSEPKFANYGINVYGPMFGIDVRLGKPRHHASE